MGQEWKAYYLLVIAPPASRGGVKTDVDPIGEE